MDIVQEGTKALKVEYDVYCKLNGTNLIKLNLTICGGSKISIIIPIEINDDLDKLNTSSGYYNDICYTTTSEDGTDISLNDRKKEYIENDKIVCQEGCSFSDYDYNNKAANCSCDAKQSSLSISDMKIDKDKLLANFKNIKNVANLNILVCIKKLFSKVGILENIGFYIFIAIINISLYLALQFHILLGIFIKEQSCLCQLYPLFRSVKKLLPHFGFKILDPFCYGGLGHEQLSRSFREIFAFSQCYKCFYRFCIHMCIPALSFLLIIIR